MDSTKILCKNHRFLKPLKIPLIKLGTLRTPEQEVLCNLLVSVCNKFIERNQIIINSMKCAICNIHFNDNFSKYFVYNDSNFILFYCDFTHNLLLGHIALADVIFRFWVMSQLTLAVYRHEYRVSKNVSIHIFWMLLSICFKHWTDVICACIPWIKIYMSILTLYKPKYIFKTFVN